MGAFSLAHRAWIWPLLASNLQSSFNGYLLHPMLIFWGGTHSVLHNPFSKYVPLTNLAVSTVAPFQIQFSTTIVRRISHNYEAALSSFEYLAANTDFGDHRRWDMEQSDKSPLGKYFSWPPLPPDHQMVTKMSGHKCKAIFKDLSKPLAKQNH